MLFKYGMHGGYIPAHTFDVLHERFLTFSGVLQVQKLLQTRSYFPTSLSERNDADGDRKGIYDASDVL